MSGARNDPLEYIRRTYGVCAFKGVRITSGSIGVPCVIVGASGPHIKVRPVGGGATRILHPEDAEYEFTPNAACDLRGGSHVSHTAIGKEKP